jgi:O-antigen ligase
MIGFYAKPLIEILAIAITIFLVLEHFSKKKIELIKVPQNILMLCLFFSILMSHIVHTYFSGLINAFTGFIVNVILFFIMLNAINTERKFKIAIWFIIGLIVLLAIQGIYQFKYGYGWAGQPLSKDYKSEAVQALSESYNIETGQLLSQDYNSEISQALPEDYNVEKGRINWVSIFNDPNDLALTFVIAVGIIIAFLFGKTKILTKIIGFPLLCILFYGIYLTNSRGGMLALMATVFFYFIKRSRKIILGAIIGTICIVAIFAFGPSRMALLSTDEESAYNRIDLWYEGISMLKSNPLFGVGYKMFQEDLPQTAHNSFVLAAAELGIVGLFFFMGLIYAAFKELSLIQKYDKRLKNYAYGLQAGLIGFCATAFFLSRTYIILPYMFFALSGSLFYIAKQKNPKMAFDFSRIDIRNTAFLSLGILTVIYVIVKVGL